MEHYEGGAFLNVDVGEDVSIRELAEMIRDVVGFDCRIEWGASKPDGSPRKLLDVSRINALGRQAMIPFRVGIEATHR